MTTRQSIALILSPVGLLIISAGRLIVVANFNTTTAVTIASSGGFVNTLLGSVIPMVPVFIPYLALILLLFRRFLLSIMAFVLTAFISPTSLTLTQGVTLAKSDWDNLAFRVADYRSAVIGLALIVLMLVWFYNRSFAEGLSILAMLGVAAALLGAVPISGAPGSVRLASNGVRHFVSQAASAPSKLSAGDLTIFLVLLLAIFVALRYGWDELSDTFGGFTGLLIGAIALGATIALVPYVHYIYPAPQDRDYYAEAMHSMWLPEERIVTDDHRIYNGYVLSSDSVWYTVLLSKGRTIVYIPATDIVERTVCQPGTKGQPKQHPPLIPWLYNAPSTIQACKGPDATFLSRPTTRGKHPPKAEIPEPKPSSNPEPDDES